jgi:hypothetical protein
MPEYASFSGQEIKDFLGSEGATYEKELTVSLRLMEQSKNLGSVMKLSLSNAARNFIENRFNEINNTDFRDINMEIVYQKIKAFIPVLLILSKKYTSVVANPPYMGQVNMNGELKDYVNSNYPLSKSDLFAVFMEVGLDIAVKKGLMGMINQHSWMFLSSYEKLREQILDYYGIVNMLHLGPRTFEELSGEVVQSTAFVLENSNAIKNATYYRLVAYKGLNEKQSNFLIRNNEYQNISQESFSKIPGSPIAYWVSSNILNVFEQNQSLIDYAVPRQGMATGDNNRFLRMWSELDINSIAFNCKDQNEASISGLKWFPYNKGGGFRKWYGSNEHVVNWKDNGKEIKDFKPSSVIRNESYYFKEGMTWTAISGGKFSGRYTSSGFLFDSKGPVLYSYNGKSHNIYMAILNSNVGNYLFQIISPTLDFNQGPLSKIPICQFDYNILEERIQILIGLSKIDWDSRETSWDFYITPLVEESFSLKTAYQKWRDSVTQDFFKLHSNEEELNRIFIEIYGLQQELSHKVELKDITILQNEIKKNDLEVLEERFRAQGKDAIELPINRGVVISQFISYCIGLFMGRYRLDKPGLNIAHPNPTKEELACYGYNHGEVTIDQDAILPMMGKNCNFNDDILKQFSQLLDTIWGHEQRTENINFIQECLDKELEKFLVNDFWKYHCGMYKKTPIYWLFSSKKGAFQVLVYMHRMNEFTVEKIRANYLLEHLKYIKSEIAQKEANASSLSTAESRQLDKLRADLIECEQYDLALKNVADQQIKFDLDDGVAKNYELFELVVAKIK